MSTISTNVMRRVRVIHTVRPLLSGTALGSALLLLAVWGIGREVWVAHVVQNLLSSIETGHVFSYLAAAFLNTRFVVQLLTLGALAALVYTAVDFVRALQSQRSLA
jgi:hypothetical protein